MLERWEMDEGASASYRLDPRYVASGANWRGERQPATTARPEGRRDRVRGARSHTAAVRGAGDRLGLEVLKARFDCRRSR